jgi:hypothetical protein
MSDIKKLCDALRSRFITSSPLPAWTTEKLYLDVKEDQLVIQIRSIGNTDRKVQLCIPVIEIEERLEIGIDNTVKTIYEELERRI